MKAFEVIWYAAGLVAIVFVCSINPLAILALPVVAVIAYHTPA